MFSTQTARPYHWNNIFTLLSMDMTDSYLNLAEFPLPSALEALKPIARNFITAYADVYPAIHVPGGEINDVIIALLGQTFDQIEARIGQGYFQSFYKWGENLLLEGNLPFSMEFVWRSVFTEFRLGKRTLDQIAEMPEDRLSQLKDLVANCDMTVFNINMTFNTLDESQNKSEWDKKVYSIYRHEGKVDLEKPDATPLSTFWVIIYYAKIKSTLLEIRDRFTPQEQSLLGNWVAQVMEEEHMTDKVLIFSEILDQLQMISVR